MSVTDAIFLFVRSLVAIGLGLSQQLVDGDVLSSYGGAGRSCRKGRGNGWHGCSRRIAMLGGQHSRRFQPDWVWPFVLTGEDGSPAVRKSDSGQCSVSGAIFRPWFDLGTESIVRVSVRASRMKLTSDSLSTHAAREVRVQRRH